MSDCWRGYNAAARGNRVRLNELLIDGANPNWCDENGFCPLRVASKNGHLECVHALLQAGATPDAVCRAHGATTATAPILSAVSYGRADCARALVNAGANIYACDHNGRNALQLSLERNRRMRVQPGDKACLALLVRTNHQLLERANHWPEAEDPPLVTNGFVVVHPDQELSLARSATVLEA